MVRFINLFKSFDADEGELTRSRKIRRTVVEQRYKTLIDAIYGGLDLVSSSVEVKFRDGRSRYEEAPGVHHDHLIDMKSGQVIEFVDEEIEALQQAIARKLGYKLVDHRLELYGVPLEE